jgi:multicomponent Na+:H+ antiporter subunit D
MLLAMGLAALLCIVIGTFPLQTLYRILPFDAPYNPYDATHVLTQIQLLFFGALAFVGLQKFHIYPAELRSVNLDADWLYRRAGRALVRGVGRAAAAVDTVFRGAAIRAMDWTFRVLSRGHGPQGHLARTHPTRSMVLWVAILLAAFLFMEWIRLEGR